MFLILKLILIILINKTNGYITQDIEIILLPIRMNLTGAKEIPLTLKVFGKLIQLNLRRKNQVLSPAFEVWKYNVKSVTEDLSRLKAAEPCFYVHKDHISSAAINFHQEYGLEGLIFVGNDILEIRPLRNVFASLFFSDDFCVKEQINQSIGKPHLIKRSLQYFVGSDFNHLHNIRFKRGDLDKVHPKKQQKVIIELAIFVGSETVEALRKVKPFNYEEIRNMMLEYVNHMQTYFHLPSLGATIDISLVRLDILENQPSNLLVQRNGKLMLQSFCNYAKTLNPPNNDPHHWDIGLYITTNDITAVTSKGNLFNFWSSSNKITGLTYPDKACRPDKSCAIVELYRDEVGNSTLISSLYAVYEIGLLLGLSTDPESRRDLIYIMSPERPSWQHIVRYDGDIIWSSRSRNMIKEKLKNKLCFQDYERPTIIMINNSDNNNDNDKNWSLYKFNNSLYHGLPGRKWTAKAQCEYRLRDKDANAVTLHDICQNLQCETPKDKDRYYFSGPSLEGTHCALKKECRGGECVPVIEPPYIFNVCKRDNWSEWRKDSCKSSCLKKSKGVVVKRRYCKHRTQRTGNCRGPYYDVDLCDDSKFCITKRNTIDDFATMKCNALQIKVRSGRQYPYDVKKPWIACTIHCQQNQSYYPERQEMLHYKIDPYFPDGTWCHNESDQNYYCRQHYCQPENHSFKESEY